MDEIVGDDTPSFAVLKRFELKFTYFWMSFHLNIMPNVHHNIPKILVEEN